jgi:hypothetical protein
VIVRDACVPNGMEVCDGLDNDCNNAVDERDACPDGCLGVSYRGSGYMLCHDDDRRRSWSEAEEECQSRGMHLVRVDDAEENAFIRKTALGVNFDGNIWLGGSDAETEGKWVWIDGTHFWTGENDGVPVGGNYTNWKPNQPNTENGREDCTEIGAGEETWHDEECSFRQAFMCQR